MTADRLFEKHGRRFLYVVGAGMEERVEGERKPFGQVIACLAPATRSHGAPVVDGAGVPFFSLIRILTGTSACNAASKLSNSFPSNARVRVIKSIGSAIFFRLFSAKINTFALRFMIYVL